MNDLFFSGNLGADPQLKTLPNGSFKCTFSVASTSSRKQADGTYKDKTEWMTFFAWNKRAQWYARDLKKGMPVTVRGSLETRKWEKDGNHFEKTECLIEEVVWPRAAREAAPQPSEEAQNFEAYQTSTSLDDIPF